MEGLVIGFGRWFWVGYEGGGGGGGAGDLSAVTFTGRPEQLSVASVHQAFHIHKLCNVLKEALQTTREQSQPDHFCCLQALTGHRGSKKHQRRCQTESREENGRYLAKLALMVQVVLIV